MKRKILITVPAAVLLLALYLVIFGFSAQNGEQSGSVSMQLSEKCVEILNNISGKHWENTAVESAAMFFEHPLRKLAHFSEYACMGILIFSIVYQWVMGKKKYLIATLWVFLSAAVDEWHQSFVPGRYASIKDVLLDTCGGICSIVLLTLIIKGRKKSRENQPRRYR